jgi:hypothetical protein
MPRTERSSDAKAPASGTSAPPRATPGATGGDSSDDDDVVPVRLDAQGKVIGSAEPTLKVPKGAAAREGGNKRDSSHGTDGGDGAEGLAAVRMAAYDGAAHAVATLPPRPTEHLFPHMACVTEDDPRPEEVTLRKAHCQITGWNKTSIPLSFSANDSAILSLPLMWYEYHRRRGTSLLELAHGSAYVMSLVPRMYSIVPTLVTDPGLAYQFMESFIDCGTRCLAVLLSPPGSRVESVTNSLLPKLLVADRDLRSLFSRAVVKDSTLSGAVSRHMLTQIDQAAALPVGTGPLAIALRDQLAAAAAATQSQHGSTQKGSRRDNRRRGSGKRGRRAHGPSAGSDSD